MVAVMNHPAEVETQIMAQIHLQPLYSFNFKYPNDWLCWKRRFEQLPCCQAYRLYCLGEEGKAVFSPTNATQEGRAKGIQHHAYDQNIWRLFWRGERRFRLSICFQSVLSTGWGLSWINLAVSTQKVANAKSTSYHLTLHHAIYSSNCLQAYWAP